MASVTSLTETKIQELMAGWESVDLSQDEINALISQLWTNVESQGASLENFNDVVLPALEADLAAGSTAVSDLLANDIPALEASITANTGDITDLNTVTLPLMEDRLHSSELWIIDLNDTILPDLNTRLDANNALIDEFNDVTLPDLNTRIAAAEAAVAAIDTTGLQADLDAAEAAIATLNTTTIPALDTRLTAAEADISAIDVTGLQSDLDAAEASISTLNTTTIPALNTRLTAAEGDVTSLEGMFPVTGPNIAAGAVTANKIAADTITANEIAANAITTAELAAGAVTANKIAADTITANEIAADAITASEIAANAVTTSELAAGAVTAVKIAAHTITANEIAADTITATEIAANAITTNELNALAVTAAKIAADTITAAQIAANAITASELAADAVTAVKILAGSVTASKIAADTITSNEIAANAITTSELAAGAVTAVKIAADTITANEIAANAITTSELAAGAVTAVKIAANTITANEIAADAITASELAAGAVVAGKIAADTVTAVEIATGTITAAEIAAATITANEIAIGSITANLIAADTITADKFATTLSIVGKTLLVGSRISLDDIGGLRIDLDDGVISFPGDGSDAYITAGARLKTLTVENNLRILGTVNKVEGGVTLANGVSAPTIQPQAGYTWTGVDAVLTADLGTALGFIQGLSNYDATTFILVETLFGGNVWLVNKTTGARTWLGAIQSNSNPCAAVSPNLDGNIYVLVTDANRSNNMYIYRMNGGVKQSEILVVAASSMYAGITPTLAVDGSTIRVGYARQTDAFLTLRTYNIDPTTKNLTYAAGSQISTALAIGTHLSGMYIGTADWGVKRIAVTTRGGSVVYVMADAADAGRDTAKEWSRANSAELRGIAWDGTRFHSLDNASHIYHYNTLLADTVRSITHTWYDNDAGGTGVHETEASPPAVVTQKKRWWLQVTTDPPQDGGGTDDPNAVRIYIANQRQADLTAGVTTAVYGIPATGGSAAPTSNGFAGVGAPGSLMSEATIGANHAIELYGNGSYRMDGQDLSGTAGWITTGFVMQTGWSNNGCKYKIRNGVVELILNCTRTGATITGAASGNVTDSPMVSIPAEARPAYDRHCLAALTAAADGAHVGFGSVQVEPTGLAILGTLHNTANTVNPGDRSIRITDTFFKV